MHRNISAPLLTKNKYSAIIQTEHKNGGAQWLRLYPIPDSDNADGGSFSYCDYTPPQYCEGVFCIYGSPYSKL